MVVTNGNIEYWTTNDLQISDLARVKCAGEASTIEELCLGSNNSAGIERYQAQSATPSQCDGVASIFVIGSR